MNKGKIIGATVGVLIAAAIVTAIVINIINGQFRYNEEGQTGNSTGNLYNKGLFCEYKGYVYFANPEDENSLYRMKSDGTDIEKLHSDTVSYIQVMNDYIYYIRRNHADEDAVIRGTLYGIYRLEIGEDIPERVYSGIVETMVICGNYIYFTAYDDVNLIQLKCIKVDGEELKEVSNLDYMPIAVWDNTYYFPNVEENHNLMYIEAGKTDIYTSSYGNFYMPTFTKNYIYYIDLDNDMKLTRVSLRANKTEVLDEGKCINYNLSESEDLIYYQIENEDEHKLCCMKLNGSDKKVVAEGNYTKIHITEKYTYYYKIISADSEELYRVDNDNYTIQMISFD